jgi:dienelactone hydrolase
MRKFVHCPECDHGFRIPSFTVAGDEVICPSCGARVAKAAENVDEVRDEDGQQPSSRARSQRRQNGSKLVVGMLVGCGALVLLCGGGLGAVMWWLLSPTPFPEQTEDYAQARQHFRTRLVRAGPSPQDGWKKERPPRGVNEIAYNSGKLRLKAWVNEPPAAAAGGRLPGILFLHSGFAFGGDDWDQVQPFLAAGYVVMIPWLRGENGLPGSFSMLYDEVDDALAAAEMLASLPYVDNQRLYVAGHCEGGTMALLAAMTSNRFRAAASFSGSPDQVRWARMNPGWVPFDPDDEREFQMRSPLAFPRSFKCPVRLYYGKQEPFAGAPNSKMAEFSQAANLDVEAVEVTGDLHFFISPAVRQCIAFFQQP